jgi:hypothetical protein
MTSGGSGALRSREGVAPSEFFERLFWRDAKNSTRDARATQKGNQSIPQFRLRHPAPPVPRFYILDFLCELSRLCDARFIPAASIR